MKILRLLFIGPPGVGKGTYAGRVSQVLSFPHVSSGDLLREESRSGSVIGKEIRALIDQGKFVPDDLMLRMIQRTLIQQAAKSPAPSGYILDGFPRTLAQAKAVDAFVAQATNQGTVANELAIPAVDAVINLRQPLGVILQKLSSRRSCQQCGMVYNYARIDADGIKMDPLVPKVEGVCDKCGSKEPLITRADDEYETVKARLESYREKTAPLEQYYEESGRLTHFDVLGGAKEYLPKLLDVIKLIREGRG